MPPTPLSLSPDRSRPELCRAGAQLRSLCARRPRVGRLARGAGQQSPPTWRSTTAGGGWGGMLQPLPCLTRPGAARLRCAARRERTTLRAATGGVVTGAMLAPEHEGWRVWTAINGAEMLAGVGATRPISRMCTRPSPTAAAPRGAGPPGPSVPCAGGSRRDVGLLARRPGLTSTLSWLTRSLMCYGSGNSRSAHKRPWR